MRGKRLKEIERRPMSVDEGKRFYRKGAEVKGRISTKELYLEINRNAELGKVWRKTRVAMHAKGG